MSTRARLTGAQADRAAGVLLASACGDSLGAGYEFGPPRIHGEDVGMVGGGTFGWAPGEWTDDTSMAVVIAQVAARGADLREQAVLDEITAGFVSWAKHAPDVGIQTRDVLSHVATDPTAAKATVYAAELFARTGRTGNGALMRTAPVALAFLHDPAARDAAARAVSALTHGDDEAGEACALWCHAIAHAVLEGTFDGLRLAVDALPPERAAVWSKRLDEAEAVAPHEIPHNGWVVAALQAAWSAITHTPVPADDLVAGTSPADHLAVALDAAVRAGDDTDTVAAIAGALLGARWGASAVPLAWTRIVHGWPGLRGRDLIRLGLLAARGGHPDSSGWPSVPVFDYSAYGDVDAFAVHSHDPGVLLGGAGVLRDLPAAVDAVVSLCRLGADEVPALGIDPQDHVEVWLVDSPDPTANPHLHHVLREAADAVADLRREGRTVLLHCVQAQSRTPTVAALYAARHLGVPADEALDAVCEALPDAHPNRVFRDAVKGAGPPRRESEVTGLEVRIHRGAHEIGGSCVELRADGATLLLDLGRPLWAARGEQIPLPDAIGLGEHGPLPVGLVLSHGHQDHWGLVPDLPEGIPVWVGQGAADVLRAAEFWGSGIDLRETGHLRHRERFEVGPFAITPYLADHSAFDAYSLLVEAGGRRLFYSGDLRGHGRKHRAFDWLLDDPPGDIDVMLLEGTNIRTEGTPGGETLASEATVEDDLLTTLKVTSGMVVVLSSAQNIDRLVTVYRAAKRAGRRLAIDLYTHEISVATGRDTIPRVGPDWPLVSAYLPNRQRVKVKQTEEFGRVEVVRGFRVFDEQLSADPGGWVLCGAFQSHIPHLLKAGLLSEGAVVWSLWDGYLAQPGATTMQHSLAAAGVPLVHHHTSGHASVADLRRLVEALAPTVLVPIHTGAPDRVADQVGHPTALKADGQWWSV